MASMRHHTTDEGWQLFAGLEHADWTLVGHALPNSLTNVPAILDAFKPSTVLLQDKREWEGRTAGGPAAGYNNQERFSSVEALLQRPDVFKLTVLKDAQNSPQYHCHSAEEIGCHAWVVYYHPRIVKHLAPFVRERHLVKTWHSVDRDIVPPFRAFTRTDRCIASGAISGAYPLRTQVRGWAGRGELPDVDWIPHPGYGRDKCHTPEYLRRLSEYKVAICTSSIYGYALRKIVEATACGCRVITDLPEDEVMPEIDGNLVRVDPAIRPREMREIVRKEIADWEPWAQERMASRAKEWYDFREVGQRLTNDIEAMRRGYSCHT